MTNEEAIHILMHMERYAAEEDGYFMICPPLMDATLLAIKALRAQRCGHWIDRGRKLECSCCGKRVYLGTEDLGIHEEEKVNMRYCSGCGARMMKEN